MTTAARPRRLAAVVVVALLASLLAACSGDPGDPGGTVPGGAAPGDARGTAATAGPGTGSGPGTSAPASAEPVYVSVGDSYASGYQPEGFSSDDGFAVQVARRLAGTPRAVRLVNLACPGATTASVLEETGCSQQPDAPGSLAHPGLTQAAALEQELTADSGRVRLVTVVLGGNDVLPCFLRDDPATCVRAALPGLTDRLGTLLTTIRRLAPDADVVGLTYPDVFLGLLVTGSPDDARRAQESVVLFRDVLNPALARTYGAAGARFVDVTARSGAYDPLTPTASFQGRAVPPSVVAVCEFTHFCESGDVHPNDAGYSWYADRVLEAAPGLAPSSPATGG